MHSTRRTIASDVRCHRAGWTRIELALVVCVGLLVASVALPLLAAWRESSRQQTCRDRLHRLSRALHDHHAAHGAFPAAAYWSVTATQSIALHESKNIPRITLDNWAVRLLPFVGRSDLAGQFDPTVSIGDDRHLEARLSSPAEMTCPSDTWNRADNPYRFQLSDAVEPVEFARGNYAISGGTQAGATAPPSTHAPNGERTVLVMQEEPRVFQKWGNGIAGINKSFSLGDVTNGQSTLIVLEELRAGVHPLDPRGVWALGQIGGSITWANGVQGDASQPNIPFFRSDDVLGCGKLHEVYGTDRLEADGMPCCHYVDQNGQAAARSLHPGGVHVAFVDTSVRFISERIDPGLWHVLHSRKTPPAVLAEQFEERLRVENFPDAGPLERPPQPSGDEPPQRVVNSIGMEFVRVSAGEFVMGVPDLGNDYDPPPECPAHPVHITRSYLLGVHEVTRGQFHSVGDDAAPARTPRDEDPEESDRFPVTDVTWLQAVEFCRRLSDLAEERAAGRSYRLPTEAEWEYACRNGTSAPYPWRSRRSPDNLSGEAAGIEPPLPLTPVGSYPPNPLGLHDLRGNAWEWTSDWFDRDYYSRSRIDDPRGPTHGYLKVVRGGDWRFIGEPCRHDYAMMPPWMANPVVGFRAVCELTGPPRGQDDRSSK